MDILHIKNWEKFQHYKHRRPPWIKLHRSILDDRDFTCLQDASKLHLMMLWVLAAQLDNDIPFDEVWLTKKLMLKKQIQLKPLIDKGFLICDSKMLAPCLQNATSETETETETEYKNSPSPMVEFDQFWKSYPKKIGKGAARKAFEKGKCAAKIAAIIRAIEKQCTSDQWRKDGGQFIPNPATWLNQERWEDEVKIAVIKPAKPITDKKQEYENKLWHLTKSLRELKTTALTPADFQNGVNILFSNYKDYPGLVKEALEIVG